MCPPKKSGSDSFDKRDAWNVSAQQFGLDAIKTGLGFFGNREKVSRKNQNIIDQHHDDIFKWNTDFDNANIVFQSENADTDAAADTLHAQAMKTIAKNQIASWNAITDSNNQAYASYAKMMSVEHGEQTGRRSGGKSRAAVLEHGFKMASLGAKLSGQLATSTLDSEMRLEAMKRQNHINEVKQAAGRPIPGTRPTLHDSELIEQDSPINLALGLGTNFLSAQDKYRSLKPKTTYKS
tara:strand:+ start:5687 stop:6397 length:711 start_codon:yes stop_codon:yes gene_type:complete